MTDNEIRSLRDDTRDLFYHGYNNYMAHAFPEDELKPISCEPQTRNKENPADIGLNDVLGNYSVTLIDSLSTLAILASDEDEQHAAKALTDFQVAVQALVELYGNGKGADEEGGCGTRACGFDLDSKVQVFETNIRGVGGLLSAHLFAVGDLPIRSRNGESAFGSDGWQYENQLLHLAHDLASRLLPAFSTATGLPYPRVNLRHGIPFYRDAAAGVCRLDGTSSDPREITETCSAGAGSLILEFTTLSRWTGDYRFEHLAKRAFWAVWDRRSAAGLVGGGLDAENGQWTMPPLSGIGAGIDSFFEYALKSHILLSGLPPPPALNSVEAGLGFVEEERWHNANEYLRVWEASHAAVKHHILRDAGEVHPYYGQSDLITGAPRYTWIDNLSAYYPGLLALAGEVVEAVQGHFVFAALWTRYAALPERWHAHTTSIDPNFRHWAGRPEFIESTWYLYRATLDPWYLHVGEMFLRDVRRRCWTRCGWADLGDVVSGVQRDRMESFFLGETAKYLYLLFSGDAHPLNRGDRAVVFTTEGHPLVVPKRLRTPAAERTERPMASGAHAEEMQAAAPTCAAPPPPLPLTVSNLAADATLFHAAALTQLHLVPINPTRSSSLTEAGVDGPGITISDIRSPTNYTFYPWTLPQSLIPPKGTSAPIARPLVSTLTFPDLRGEAETGQMMGMVPLGALQKVVEGVLINSLSNIRLNMVQEPRKAGFGTGGVAVGSGEREFRIQGIANWALGRDEKVLVSQEALAQIAPADPHFTRVKDLEMVDLVVDARAGSGAGAGEWEVEIEVPANGTVESLWGELEAMVSGLLHSSSSASTAPAVPRQATLARHVIPAILPTGAGAAPLPALMDPSTGHAESMQLPLGGLPLPTIYFLDSTLCPPLRLPLGIAKHYNILVIKRGDCSFGEKLSAIPSFAPSSEALQLVTVLSVPESRSLGEAGKGPGELIRPLLDEVQRTPNGVERRHPIPMVMVDGGEETVAALRGAASGAGAFDERGKLSEEDDPAREVKDPGEEGRTGLGVQRRYWFESMGVPIANLVML